MIYKTFTTASYMILIISTTQAIQSSFYSGDLPRCGILLYSLFILLRITVKILSQLLSFFDPVHLWVGIINNFLQVLQRL